MNQEQLESVMGLIIYSGNAKVMQWKPSVLLKR